jgi:hypothetical protein
MDEESMALVEELRGFVLQTVKVREETADTLAMALIAAYDIKGRDGALPQQPLSQRALVGRSTKGGTTVQRAVEDDSEMDNGIVKASDLFDPNNPLSQAERDEILQERIETRLIAQAAIPSKVATRNVGAAHQLTDTEMAESPVLEAQRLRRLQEQEARELAGVSKIRRSE